MPDGFQTATGDEALSITGERLRSFVERIENVEGEIANLNQDKKEIYAEAKGSGFDVPTIKTMIKMRRKDLNERKEEEALLETYMAALGMV